MVQKLSRAHLSVVSDDRRERAREKKRIAILRAADAIVGEEGVAGITMQRVAERLDCAVGTLYLYFPSKAALVTALQGEAIATLRASYALTTEQVAAYLATAGLDDVIDAYVGLLSFSEFWIAASVVFADEFHLQRSLLTEPVAHRSAEELTALRPLVDQLLTDPTTCIRVAATAGSWSGTEPPDARALAWVSSLDGVLLLEGLALLDQHQFRGHHVARMVTHDLVIGWGAAPNDVEVAEAHIERLAATVPMAPRLPDDR